uniref:Uncharacterized protein n=1 Tax=Florenciella sp. virus SA2 TaxID=3240092 RepID=A0AB39JBM0_9VIRU
MCKKKILNKFISIYFELLEYIKSFLKESSKEFNLFYKKNIILRKTNVKMFIKTWYENISVKYYDKIKNEDAEFFFVEERNKQKDNITMYIDLIRDKYNNTDKNIIKSIIEKIKILTDISILYFNSN